MLIRNLRIEDALTTSDVRVEEGRFAAIEQHLESLPGEEVVDAAGRLGLPPIIESHVHLDSALT
ncbi:MAG TPA: cytosine deaminase, partial [Brevibacterium sp.]|nr:cytosine deaminase [Brevibacterium sp.]